MLRAGFAEIDITPPLGAEIAGWLKRIESQRVLDPLYARAAVLESAEQRLGVVQFDLCYVTAALAARLRLAIAARCAVAPEAILVATTHNHAGPVTETGGECTADAAYIDQLVERTANMFAAALDGAVPAEIAQASGFCFDVAHNRRVRMRDGTVCTHGNFRQADALCYDGPIDPEVAVLAARAVSGEPLGLIVTFACHPTHHGSDAALSAGFPGALAAALKAQGWPVPLFLNGAAGNLHTADPSRGGANPSKDEAGQRLAQAVLTVLQDVEYCSEAALAFGNRTIALPYRTVTESERLGQVVGAQRFVDSGIYDKEMADLVAWMVANRTEDVEIQVLDVGDRTYACVPCELFVELGLQIKERCHPRRTVVVGYANGSLGYMPHREAFARGGYETTLGRHSRFAPGAGEQLADAAVALVNRMSDEPPSGAPS